MYNRLEIKNIHLPISKSIANRLLILKALRGDDLALFPIDKSTPDDVKLLHEILRTEKRSGERIDCRNCGTAMRFLTAYYAQKDGIKVILDGDERMQKRPIGQEVDILRQLGANVHYLSEEGFPPLFIVGTQLQKKQVEILNPESSQFVSALRLIGIDVKNNMSSPYVGMTEAIMRSGIDEQEMEKDWSAAAFWYEYIALHGGNILLLGLKNKSLQGDRVVADIFEKFGVNTTFTNNGVYIERTTKPIDKLVYDFSCCPDLYPAVYATCHKLGIKMYFTGLQSLPLKESDRLQAMQQMLLEQHIYSSFADHRIAMALIMAGYEVDDTDCISKSYPQFMQQWNAL